VNTLEDSLDRPNEFLRKHSATGKKEVIKEITIQSKSNKPFLENRGIQDVNNIYKLL